MRLRIGMLFLLAAAATRAQVNAGVDSPAPVVFQSLASFGGKDGREPFSPLVQGREGALYGITVDGGANDAPTFCNRGCGTVFSISLPSGGFTKQADFCDALPCANEFPIGLTLGIGGFYGTAQYNTVGGGTVFAGFGQTIYHFCSQPDCDDGQLPAGTVIQGNDGDLFGTTVYGGANYDGTVFKLNPITGALTTIHSFNETDGEFPGAALVRGTNGTLYGTTTAGGAHGGGTVFRITPAGEFTKMYDFCSKRNCADGRNPVVLIEGSDGDFYGTTTEAIGTSYPGTIYKLTANGTLTTLYTFCQQTNCADGSYPTGLIQASDGLLYGTSYWGGAFGNGTVFRLSLDGDLRVLYNFCAQEGCADGSEPWGGVTQGTDGNLYGTTSHGGAKKSCPSCGTVFKLSVGLSPFVTTVPTSGPVGTPVTILGTNLFNVTGVTFNGTTAAFTVNSTFSAISTSVPAGASTGKIAVTTTTGTLTSNPRFWVQ
jgi:uncharacterized repeat protein (TIGR03803 family)